MRLFFISAAVFAAVFITEGLYGQSPDSVSAANKAAQLKSLESQFRQLQSTNKNAQALEVIQRYGQLYTAKLQENRSQQVRELENSFIKNSAKRKTELNLVREKSAALTAEIESLESSRDRLNSGVLLFFALLTTIIVSILVIRNRKLRKMQALLSSSEKASQQLASLIESGNLKPAASQEGKNKIAHLVKEVDANLDKFTRVSDDKNHPAGRTIRQFLTELKQSERISIIDFTNPISEVKTKTNLNELIKDVAALANEDFRKSSPEFEFELLLDLEGILPDIEIYDPELREALFCLISNSMRAVQSRSGSAPKGYKPKVTVSSRKLPRFIQIRIRHNGLETMLEQSDDNVMLSDSMDDNNKILGMQVAKEIITERHKGEIAFETEPGSQTDTIIRFQTYILQ